MPVLLEEVTVAEELILLIALTFAETWQKVRRNLFCVDTCMKKLRGGGFHQSRTGTSKVFLKPVLPAHTHFDAGDGAKVGMHSLVWPSVACTLSHLWFEPVFLALATISVYLHLGHYQSSSSGKAVRPRHLRW